MGDERARWSWAAGIRWVHTYLSLAGFAALLFFAVTGLTLNHADWFESGNERERAWEATVPRELLPQEAEPDAEVLASWLRREHGVRGELHDWSSDGERALLVLKGPGYSVDADLDLRAATASLRERRLNAWAVMDDLHKGRDSGGVWAWIIDISAVVTALSAVTGLWLLFYVRKRRNPGLWVTVVGLAVLAAAAWLLTP